MTENAPEKNKPLSIWVVTDNKPGHLNQIKGLCERIAAHEKTVEHWIPVTESKTQWLDYVLGRYKALDDENNLIKPDLVIGAGHSTHKDILAIKRAFNCFSVVLMKPSLPIKSFNAAIIPEHDTPGTRENTLITKGALNTVEPISQCTLEANKSRGLILLGGESKHYYWDTNQIVTQVKHIVHTTPETQWVLSDSRRTPPEVLSMLAADPASNLTLTPHTDTQPGWVNSQIRSASTIWVTPDSVSMVYESITSNVPTGVLKMRPKKKGRIVKGIIQLIAEGWVTELSVDNEAPQRPSSPPSPLWESERAATWLLERYTAFIDDTRNARASS